MSYSLTSTSFSNNNVMEGEVVGPRPFGCVCNLSIIKKEADATSMFWLKGTFLTKCLISLSLSLYFLEIAALSSYYRSDGNCFSLYIMFVLVLMLFHKFLQKVTHRKDGSNVRPKSSLEKAIRELEKMVAECKAINFL